MERLLLPRLNEALSSVFEGIEAQQVEASLLRGRLSLRNLRIKREALAATSLPIDISFGAIDRLEVKFNLLRFLSAPIFVRINKALVVATTKPSTSWSVEEETTNRDELRRLVLLTDECLTFAREGQGLPSLLQRILYAFIRRLRIEASQVELRLEETEISDRQPFALGVSLGWLSTAEEKQTSARPAALPEQQPQVNKSGLINSNNNNNPTATSSNYSNNKNKSKNSQDSNKSNNQTESRGQQSFVGWIRWLTGLASRAGVSALQKTESSARVEEVPSSFATELRMEQASLYLDRLHREPRQKGNAPWIPQPASYRRRLLRQLEEDIKKHEETDAAQQKKPERLAPLAGEFAGEAPLLSLAIIRKRIKYKTKPTSDAATPEKKTEAKKKKEPTLQKSKKRTRNAASTLSDATRFCGGRPCPNWEEEEIDEDEDEDEDEPEDEQEFEQEFEEGGEESQSRDDAVSDTERNAACQKSLEKKSHFKLTETERREQERDRSASETSPSRSLSLNDVVDSEALWKLAAEEAPSHSFIFAPTTFRVRLNCTQRPVIGNLATERCFRRPVKEGAVSDPTEDDVLPALSVGFVFTDCNFSFSPFQLASILRWFHYGFILYQEVVNGVYTDLMEAKPSPSEVEAYKAAWRRHLITSAVAACGLDVRHGDDFEGAAARGEGSLSLGGSASDALPDEDSEASYEESLKKDIKTIRRFEEIAWFPEVLTARREVLQDLRDEVHSRLAKGEFEDSPDLREMPSTSLNASLTETTVAERRDGKGSSLPNGEEEANAAKIHSLMEGVAGELATELSLASAADQEVMGKLLRLTSLRISKSFRLSLELERASVALVPDGLENSLRHLRSAVLSVHSFYTHIELYYDFRMSLASAVRGIRLVDALSPALALKGVLLSCAGNKRKDGTARHSVLRNASLTHGGRQASLNFLREAPPSPLQGGSNVCCFSIGNGGSCDLSCGGGASCGFAPTAAFSGLDGIGKSADFNEEEALPGGWVRFDQVYAQLPGIPDKRLYVQTNGVHLLTLSPEALAFVVSLLVAPVELGERKAILSKANSHVQNVIHRNEVFTAQLLVGEVEPLNIDICVDIPAPQLLLLPRDSRSASSEGMLIQSGVWSVDSRIQLPRACRSAFHSGLTRLSYDRYAAAGSGVCLYRVCDCSAVQMQLAETDFQLAAKVIAATEGDDTRHRQRDKRLGRRATQVSRVSESKNQHREKPTSEESAALRVDLIVKPCGLQLCADLCHFRDPPDMPAFRLWIQNNSPVCIRVSDDDFKKSFEYLAKVLPLLPSVSVPGKEEVGSEAPGCSVSLACKGKQGGGSPSSLSSSETSSFFGDTRRPDCQAGSSDIRSTRASVLPLKKRPNAKRKSSYFYADQSGSLSESLSSEDSSVSQLRGFSAFRRATLYIHRALKTGRMHVQSESGMGGEAGRTVLRKDEGPATEEPPLWLNHWKLAATPSSDGRPLAPSEDSISSKDSRVVEGAEHRHSEEPVATVVELSSSPSSSSSSTPPSPSPIDAGTTAARVCDSASSSPSEVTSSSPPPPPRASLVSFEVLCNMHHVSFHLAKDVGAAEECVSLKKLDRALLSFGIGTSRLFVASSPHRDSIHCSLTLHEVFASQDCPPSQPSTVVVSSVAPLVNGASQKSVVGSPPGESSLRQRFSIAGLSARTSWPLEMSSEAQRGAASGVCADSSTGAFEGRLRSSGGGISNASETGVSGRVFGCSLHVLRFSPPGFLESPLEGPGESQRVKAALIALATALAGQAPVAASTLQSLSSSNRFRIWSRFCFPPLYPGERREGLLSSSSEAAVFHEAEELVVRDLQSGICHCLPASLLTCGASRKEKNAFSFLPSGTPDVSVDALICFRVLAVSAKAEVRPCRVSVDWRGISDLTDTLVSIATAASEALSSSSSSASSSSSSEALASSRASVALSVETEKRPDRASLEACGREGSSECLSADPDDTSNNRLLGTFEKEEISVNLEKDSQAMPALQLHFRLSLQRVEVVLPTATSSPLADFPFSAISWGALKAAVLGESAFSNSISTSVPRSFARSPKAALNNSSPRTAVANAEEMLCGVDDLEKGFLGDGVRSSGVEGLQIKLPQRRGLTRRESASLRRGSGLTGKAVFSEEELATLQVLLEASPPLFVSAFTCAFSYSSPTLPDSVAAEAPLATDELPSESLVVEAAPLRRTVARSEFRISKVRLALLVPPGSCVKATPAFFAEVERLASRSPREAFWTSSLRGHFAPEGVEEARWNVSSWTLSLFDVYCFLRKLKSQSATGGLAEACVGGSGSMASFSQSGSEAGLGNLNTFWLSGNAASGPGVQSKAGFRSQASQRRAHQSSRRSLPTRHSVIDGFSAQASLDISSFKAEQSGVAQCPRCNVLFEVEPIAVRRISRILQRDRLTAYSLDAHITLDPPVVAHSLFLLKVVGEVFGLSAEAPKATAKAPEDGPSLKEETADLDGSFKKKKSTRRFSLNSTNENAASSLKRRSRSKPLRLETVEEETKTEEETPDGDNAETNSSSALLETLASVWSVIHSIRSSLDVRFRVEFLRIQCQALHIAVEEFVSWVVINPQTLPASREAAPVQASSKTTQNSGGRLTLWGSTPDSTRKKSPSVLVEAQRAQVTGLSRMGIDEVSSKASDECRRNQEARPPSSSFPLENELSWGFEVLVSIDGLHRSQMSLESVLEPWLCSASVTYTPAPLLLQYLPLTSNKRRAHMLGAKQRAAGLSGRLERGVGASFRETAMQLLPSHLREKLAPGVQTAAQSAVSSNRRDAGGTLSSRTQKLRELARSFGKEGAELQGGIECSWLNLTVAPFVVDAFMDTADAIEESHRAAASAVASLYAAAVYIYRNGLTGELFLARLSLLKFEPVSAHGFLRGDCHAFASSDTRATSSECISKRLALETLTPFTRPNMTGVSSRDSLRESAETASLPSSSSGNSSSASASHASSSASSSPAPDADGHSCVAANGVAVEGADANSSIHEEMIINRDRQAPDAEGTSRDGAPCLVNLTGQAIALRFVRRRRRVPSREMREVRVASDIRPFQLSVESRIGAGCENTIQIGEASRLPSVCPQHENSACSEGGLPDWHQLSHGDRSVGVHSSVHPFYRDEDFEWKVVGAGETVTLPQDDHGQPLPVTVRVQLVGHEFDVSDLRLDASHTEVRLLPLKIAVEGRGGVGQGETESSRRRRMISMLSFRARLVVRTVFLPEHRSFHIFLSSALSIRNNTQHAMLVFPHPSVAKLENADGALDGRASSTLDSEVAISSSLGSASPALSRQGSASPAASTGIRSRETAVKGEAGEAGEGTEFDIPLLRRDISPSEANAQNGPISFVNGDRFTSTHFRSAETEVRLCVQPLEVSADGGAVNVPLRWILPRAVVFHGLQWHGAFETRSGNALSSGLLRTGERQATRGISASEVKGKIARAPSAPPSFSSSSRASAWGRWLREKLPSWRRRKSARNVTRRGPFTAGDTDTPVESGQAHTAGNRGLDEWSGDSAVENLLVLPLQTFLAGAQKQREEKISKHVVLPLDEEDVLLEAPRSLRSAGDVEDFGRDARRISRQTSFQHNRSFLEVASSEGFVLPVAKSFSGSREAPSSPTAGMSYEEVFELAVKLGAQPLLKCSALQKIAEAKSNNVNCYSFKPHVLEFSEASALNAEGEEFEIDKPQTELATMEKLRGAGRSFGETGEASCSGCLAFAVSVCAMSRELFSEADPLFFQVALSPPLTVGNRLFESLRVSVLSSPLVWRGRPLVARSLSAVSSGEHGFSASSSLSNFKVGAGADVAVERVTKGLVFSFETGSVTNPFRFVFSSKPLLIDYHGEAPSAGPVDFELSFFRSAILKPNGSILGPDSALFRSVVRCFPSEICLIAEVAGAALGSSSSLSRMSDRLAWQDATLLNLQRHVWGSCARSVKVFAPYWVINRQARPLFVSQKHQPAQCLGACDWRMFGVPVDGNHLLSLALAVEKELPRLDCSDEGVSEGAMFRAVRGSKNCRPFRVDILGRPLAVPVPPSPASGVEKRVALSEGPRKPHLFGVTVALAPPPFARSKIVSIFCRFSLKNNLSRDLWIRDGPSSGGGSSSGVVCLSAGSEEAFHPQNVGSRGHAFISLSLTSPELLQRLVEAEASRPTSNTDLLQSDQQQLLSASRRMRNLERAVWSPALSLGRSTSFQIRMRLPNLPSGTTRRSATTKHSSSEKTERSSRRTPGSLWRYENLQVDVQGIEGTSFRVVFSSASVGEFLLVNKTSRLLAFAQSGVRDKFAWDLLRSDESAEFAWPDPQRERRLLKVSVLDAGQSVTRVFEISRIKTHRPIVLPANRGRVQLTTDVQQGRRRVLVTEEVEETLRRAPSGAAFGGAWRSLFKKNNGRLSRVSTTRRLNRNSRTGTGLSVSPASAMRIRVSSVRDHTSVARLHWQCASRGQEQESARNGTAQNKDATSSRSPTARVQIRHSSLAKVRQRQSSIPGESSGAGGVTASRKVLRFRCNANATSSGGAPGGKVSLMGSGDSASEEGEDRASSLKDIAACERRKKKKLALVSRPRRLRGAGYNATGNVFLRGIDSRLSSVGANETKGEASASSLGAALRRKRSHVHRGAIVSASTLRGGSISSEIDSLEELYPQLFPRDEADSKAASFADMSCHVSFRVAGFGLSVVDATPQELAYVAGADFKVEVRRLHAASAWNFRLSLRFLQVDNGVLAAHDRTILRRMTLEERAKHHGSGDGRRARVPVPMSYDDSVLGGTSASSETAVKSLLRTHTFWSEAEERAGEDESLFFRIQFGGERLPEATLLQYVDVWLSPMSVHFEADTAFELLRFLLRLLRNRGFFIRSIQDQNVFLVRQAAVVNVGDSPSAGFKEFRSIPSLPPSSRPLTRRPLYVQALCVRPLVILFSARAPRLNRRQAGDTPEELVALRPFEIVGGRIADITDLPLKARSVVQMSVFSTTDKLLEDLAATYMQQGIRQLHKLVASIDLLGNPLALITGVLASVRALFAKRNSAEEAAVERTVLASLAQDVLRCLVNVAGELVGALSNLFGAEFKLLELLGVLDVSALLALWPTEMRVERRRIEKPENFFDGLKAAGMGIVQVLIASVVSVVAFPLRGMRLTGVSGCLRGLVSGVLHLFLGVFSSVFVAATALTAGASSSLRQTSLVARTRPPRVFSADLAVRPYGYHEAQAFGLLAGSLDPVLPGNLRSFVAAYPLPSVKAVKARGGASGAGTGAPGGGNGFNLQFNEEPARRSAFLASSRDYLVETAELLFCIRNGQLAWVCRKEDLTRCSVEAPVFLAEAFRAQQELLVHRRGDRNGGAGALGAGSPLDAFDARASSTGGAIFTVRLQLRNSLSLSDTVLRNAGAACRTYLQHAAEKRGVVEAIKKKLGFRASGDSAMALASLAALNAEIAEEEKDASLSSQLLLLATTEASLAALRRQQQHREAESVVASRVSQMGIKIPEAVLRESPGARRSERRFIKRDMSPNTQRTLAPSQSLRQSPSTSVGVVLDFLGRAFRTLKTWVKVGATLVKRRLASVLRKKAKKTIKASASLNTATPEVFTLEIALPDSASAFRVFDVVSSLIDAKR